VLTRRAPEADEQSDLAFAYRIADIVAGLDIGQTIAVKSAAVVAGAMEGTDAIIARAGQLAGAGVRIGQGLRRPTRTCASNVPVVRCVVRSAMKAWARLFCRSTPGRP